MKNRSSLTTGEFARLCRTTKETLFHYDKLNLLKPKNVLENGYRYYGVEQFFEFDLIAILKETGTPLKEIKELIHTMDAERLLSLLNEKILFIKKEKDRLAQREDMLHDMMRSTSESMSTVKNFTHYKNKALTKMGRALSSKLKSNQRIGLSANG